MANSKIVSGNLLGTPRAESDLKMLATAFVETEDFHALVDTRDFNFVVGRRGTGKSALFLKVSEALNKEKSVYRYSKSSSEYDSLSLLSTVIGVSKDYHAIRSITRVAWRASLLIDLLNDVRSHYKLDRCDNVKNLCDFSERFRHLSNYDCFERTTEILKTAHKQCSDVLKIPVTIAKLFSVEDLNAAIVEALRTYSKTAVFLFDGLDEGWSPNQTSTAIVGGLAAAASDFADRQSSVQVTLFLRDNIFRSLSFFDRDFSRHIEGNTLRLRWDDSSLLHFVANRLRATFGLNSIESDIKVWNRFAQRGLENREGFSSCLNYTLYRPRDLLVLLNEAFVFAARSGRQQIVKEDIELTSKQISQNRLEDLLKEYDTVFPGLPLFIDVFKGKPSSQTFGIIISLLDEAIKYQNYEEQGASDFAILGNGKQAFFALYSIGFIGLSNESTQTLQFCHDGSSANIDATNSEQRACIHPCYWKALNIQAERSEGDVLIDVYDDQSFTEKKEIEDFRMKMIGELVSELPVMTEGAEDSEKFEQWVFRTIKILFSGLLSNPELKPNSDAIQRRDIVATNMAKEGFWRRIREDYSARQVVFEIKNYSTLKIEDFRQALSYSTDAYGKFIIIVNRNQNEGASELEKGWIKEIWDQHKVLVFTLPAIFLSRCVRKLRSRARFDYIDKQLGKRLDTFIRSYLSLRHRKKT